MDYLEKGANISECGKYRNTLFRVWDNSKSGCIFIGLNPSTADASKDDPTIRRCVNFASDWGCGEIHMLNLFAYRATKPKDMLAAENPIGQADSFLRVYTTSSQNKYVIAAWGATETKGRAAEVVAMLNDWGVPLYHLGLTKNGSPKHPLYLKADTKPTLWEPTQ